MQVVRLVTVMGSRLTRKASVKASRLAMPCAPAAAYVTKKCTQSATASVMMHNMAAVETSVSVMPTQPAIPSAALTDKPMTPSVRIAGSSARKNTSMPTRITAKVAGVSTAKSRRMICPKVSLRMVTPVTRTVSPGSLASNSSRSA